MFGKKNVISGGSTGLIERLPSGGVRKCAYPDLDGRNQSLRDLNHEFRIYQRLPRQHDRLVQLIRYAPEDGVVLQYMLRGNLRDHIQNAGTRITLLQRLQWACDAAEALQLLHSHDIIHWEVKPGNFLLHSASRLKIIDFSGSSFDGKLGFAFEGTRFCLPRSWDDESTVRTDLFALGSTIYEIMTSKQPYQGLPDEEVETRYSKHMFPGVDKIHCGQVIVDCWRGNIKTAEEVMVLTKGKMDKARFKVGNHDSGP
jgi:serine/threonine protein kinase